MIRPALPLPAIGRSMPRLGRWIGLAVGAGVLLALLGPFGSYMNGGPARRLGYWVGAMLLGLVLYGVAFRAADATASSRTRRWWLVLGAFGLLASIPEAMATRAAAFRLWPELAGLHLSWPSWFAQTALLGLVATFGVAAAPRPASSRPNGDAAPRRTVAPVVLPLGGDVLALQMEDHYVRVHRAGGSELVLMPLGAAVAAMQAEGLRTHRSWWVARHAVAAVEGDARSMRVRLSNGVVAPVARSAVTRLRTAGWIAEEDVPRLGRDRLPET